MSKESAMAMTGSTAPVNHSILTGEIPNGVSTNPGLTAEQTTNPVVERALDSDRFAILAKKEAKIVREQQAFKAEQAKLADEKTRLTEFYNKIQRYEELKKADPIAAIKELGFSETDLFNYLSGQEKKEPTTEELASKAAQDAIDKFKVEQSKIQNEAQKARDDGIIKRFHGQIGESIEKNKDKYEYCAFNGPLAQELAFDLVNQVLKDSKGSELLSIDEALDMVENYYEEQDKSMSTLKKRQPKVEAAPIKSKEPERTRTITPPIGAPATKTLSNKVSPTVASTVKLVETHEQKKTRLIEALKRGSL